MDGNRTVETPLDVVRKHLDYHLSIEDPTREQQRCREERIIQDYRGQVLIELFQNAIDRAESEVSFQLIDTDLFLATNDGIPVSVRPIGAAQNGRLDRSDFHALCSSDTSRKRACEQIGNKGIGFKSVFSVASAADIWSLHPEYGWWGFRLRHPFTAENAVAVARRADQSFAGWQSFWTKVAERVDRVPAPSFYFPEPLAEKDRPGTITHATRTAIVLHLREGHDLQEQLTRFQSTRLHFVAARYPAKLGVRVKVCETARTIRPIDGWATFPETPHPRPDLVDAARAEHLDFDTEHSPAVWLAFPPEGHQFRPRFHCFFPTDITCGFSCDIHADFAVGQSRKSLDFGSFNGKLLDTAAYLLLDAFEQYLYRRADAWRFLTPGTGASEALVRRLQARLFGKDWDRPRRWVQITTLSFATWNDRGGAPWRYYSDFWALFAAWWPYFQGGRRTWVRHFAAKALHPLRDARVPCIPMAQARSGQGIHYLGGPLPTDERTVLLRRPREGVTFTVPAIPTALAPTIAVIADFPESGDSSWAGLKDYRWETLAIDLRRWITGALPPGRPRWSPDDPGYAIVLAERMNTLDHDEKRQWLRFAFRAALSAEGATAPPGERLLHRAADRLIGDKVETADLLRAESALPLPVVGGGLLPACRVATNQSCDVFSAAAATEGWGILDRDAMRDLGFNGDEIQAVTKRLGCFPVLPLLSSRDAPGVHLPFDPESLDSNGWKRLLEQLSMDSDSYRTLIEIAGWAEEVQAAKWLPVKDDRVAPCEAWMVPPRDPIQYSLLPVIRPPGSMEWLLQGLGVRRLPRRDGAIEPGIETKAARSLATLASSGEPGQEHERLYRRLIRGIQSHVDGLPVLVRLPDGVLIWAPDERAEAVLVAERAHGMARYFPELSFVCASGTRELAKSLGVRLFDPEVTLCHLGNAPEADPAMKRRLRQCMPWLLAVSELVPTGSRRSIEEIARAWEFVNVRKATNVFLDVAQEGLPTVQIGLADQDGIPILDDVFVHPDGTAWHDARSEREGAARWLHRFAPWFAKQVFETLELERPFRSFLEHLGQDWDSNESDLPRAHRHLDNHQGDPARVHALRREFEAMCLPTEERAAMLAERAKILGTFGVLSNDADLSGPVLSPIVFKPDGILRLKATDMEIQEALAHARYGFQAEFACIEFHRRSWRSSKESLRRPILAAHLLRKNLTAWDEESVLNLHRAWDETEPTTDVLRQLGFTPESFAVSSFPTPSTDLSPKVLEAALEIIDRRPVAKLGKADIQLQRITVRPPGAGLVRGSREESKRRNRERGENAELARAREAATRLQQLHSHDAQRWQEIIDRERERIRQELPHGHRVDVLEPIDWATARLDDTIGALHMAQTVDCGYDVLDVDTETGMLVQVEVKATQQLGPTCSIHLTPNELRRAVQTRRLNDDGVPITWRLELYLGLHRRIDLTNTIYQALSGEVSRSVLFDLSALEVVDLILHITIDATPSAHSIDVDDDG